MKPIKIKVLKGSDRVINKTFSLTEKEKGLYYCKNNKVEIVDGLGELKFIIEVNSETGEQIFSTINLVTGSYGSLQFIKEVRLYNKTI